MLAKVLNLLLKLTPDILLFKKTDTKAKSNFRHFIGFLVHAIRLLIVC